MTLNEWKAEVRKVHRRVRFEYSGTHESHPDTHHAAFDASDEQVAGYDGPNNFWIEGHEDGDFPNLGCPTCE